MPTPTSRITVNSTTTKTDQYNCIISDSNTMSDTDFDYMIFCYVE